MSEELLALTPELSAVRAGRPLECFSDGGCAPPTAAADFHQTKAEEPQRKPLDGGEGEAEPREPPAAPVCAEFPPRGALRTWEELSKGPFQHFCD